MRDLLSKLTTGTMIAGAALLVSACGSTEPANNTTANVEEMNTEDSMMNGTTNDMMTNTDGAMMDGNNMAMDNMDNMGNMAADNMSNMSNGNAM